MQHAEAANVLEVKHAEEQRRIHAGDEQPANHARGGEPADDKDPQRHDRVGKARLGCYVAERDGIPQAELGDVCGVDANNLVLLLNELETAGFAQRRRDPEDRRRHIVEITETGRTAFRRSEQAREEVEDEVLAALDADQRDTLLPLLAKALRD